MPEPQKKQCCGFVLQPTRLAHCHYILDAQLLSPYQQCVIRQEQYQHLHTLVEADETKLCKPASRIRCILCWVQAFSNRAGSAKKEVGMEDVMLAIQAKATTSFVAPPAQDVSAPVTPHSCLAAFCYFYA